MGEESCPACGVYLSGSTMLEEQAPYQAEEIPPAPYAIQEEVVEEEVLEEPPSENLLKELILPLGSLLFGLVFFLFGMMLLFFSHEGYLTLRWSSDSWYLYMGMSLPLVFAGWRLLDK